MLTSLGCAIQHYYKLHPFMLFSIILSVGMIFVVLSVYSGQFNMMPSYKKFEGNMDSYPFAKFRNLVMVAGHSVFTSSSCEKVEKEGAWLLEPYEKHPGQAATFVTHIQKGVECAANDDETLLLFSGGETGKDAGPRSEAQSYSYWIVAELKHWFGDCDVWYYLDKFFK